MKRTRLLLLAIVVALAVPPIATAQAKTSLRGTTSYEFVLPLGIVDGQGRVLAWEGTASGDIDGVIRWWAEPGDTFTGQVHHYSLRMELLDPTGTQLLLAAQVNGSTTARHMKNSNWRENGIVTEASAEYEDWIGRRVHERGHFTWQVIDTPDGPMIIPEAGTSTFRIN